MKRDRDRGKAAAAAGKAKMWAEEQQQQQQPDAGMDELFAVLGYKVKSSDMADVAEKLEQLEMAMVGGGASLLSSADTVHYNPSDLSGWVQSMLSELTSSVPPPDNQTGISSSPPRNNNNPISFSNDKRKAEPDHGTKFICDDDDLRAIPGGAIFSSNKDDCEDDSGTVNINNKRMKSSAPVSEFLRNGSPPRPVVVVDSQEAGVRLVRSLMACGEAVQQEHTKLADALLKHVVNLAASQVGAVRKVATYFAEALARRIYKIYPKDETNSDALEMHFYETAPYLKFAHFTANQAILEAFAGAARVHVVDFSLKQGMQWPALIQALAQRPGGPPAFRLTGIGPPQPDGNDAVQQVGLKLAQLAETVGVEFEFRGFVASSLADLNAEMLDVRKGESLAVNSVFELHRLLGRPGSVERVLNLVREMGPKIVTVVEQEGNHNGDVFLDRFNEALHYYSTMFDSLEGSSSSGSERDAEMTDHYLGRQICNVVAGDGSDRVERHETLARWRVRMASAGFDPVHLGSNAFKQASMLLALFAGGDGYRVEEREGCLMLGWHTRPLIATSAWRTAE